MTIPVGAIVAAAAWALRASNGAAAASPQRGSGRRLGALLVWVFVWPALGVSQLLATKLLGAWVRTPFFLLTLLILFPWPITQRILIPLGMVRSAEYLTLLALVAFPTDSQGASALAACCAYLARKKADPRLIDRIDRRLAKSKPLGPGGAVAAGLVAACRGDRAQARSVLKALLYFDPRFKKTIAVRLGHEWLVADAASRGDWLKAHRLSTRAGQTGNSRLMGRIAQRLLGLGAISPLRLWWSWLLCSRRWAMLPLVRRALAARPGEAERRPPEPVSVLLPEETPPLISALGFEAAVLRRPPTLLQSDDLRALAIAWDRALGDPKTKLLAESRAESLELEDDGAVALAQIAREAESDLAELILAAERPLAELRSATPDSPLLNRASRKVRDRLLTELETTSEAIARRVIEGRALPAADEWREWAAFSAAAARAGRIGGIDLRRLAFPRLHPDLSKLAVWLFNVRKERPIAHAIFRWLLIEAQAVEDSAAIELEQRNVNAGSG